MYYAADNQISTSPIEGGIEITAEQYSAALGGMAEGKRVTVDGGQLVVAFPPEPEPPEPEPQEPEPDTVPQIVSRFQARAALHLAGLLDQVEALIADADPIAQIAWQDAVEFRRDSPTINGLAAQIGMTQEQLDDLFRAAAGITA